MHYMFLIYTDETAEAEMTPEQRKAMIEPHIAFARETRERGIFVAGDELRPTHTATTLSVRDGRTITTDGPYTETKEQLGGFYILDCKDLDDALELAARIPSASYGYVEIRPIADYSGAA